MRRRDVRNEQAAREELQYQLRESARDPRPGDLDEAVKLLGRALKRNRVGSEKFLKKQLQLATRLSKSFALNLLHAAAENGVCAAQKVLGEKYLRGRGVKLDYRLAVKWIGLATKCGQPGALQLLRQHLQQVGRHRRPKDLPFLQAAAEVGMTEAQTMLGERYLSGRGAQRNYQLAGEWLRRAAKQGNADALYHLGTMHLNGFGVYPNRKCALEKITEAAKRKCLDAQHHLVRMHLDSKDTYFDLPTVLEWLGRTAELAAKCSDERSKILLKEAKKWLVRTANGNDAQAQFIVGRMHYHGIAVPRDRCTALKWFQKAAERGHKKARILIARNACGGGPTGSMPPGSTGSAHT